MQLLSKRELVVVILVKMNKSQPKLNILMIGYSNFARKSIIEAIEKNNHLHLKAIASKNHFNLIPKKYQAYKSYKEAIDQSNCNVVYISLHNIAHYPWVLYALKKNKHIICDKPAFLSLKEAQRCISQAKGKLLIYENICALLHKQHVVLKKLIQKQSSFLRITALFGFPIQLANFRNYSNLGGGCIYDIGPYLISIGRYYFDQSPLRIYCLADNKTVPKRASVTIDFGKNRILQSHFGFGLEYQNSLQIWGSSFQYEISRAFSIPPNFKASIEFKIKDQEGLEKIGADDCFSNMLKNFLAILQKNDFSEYNKSVLVQAAALEAMVKSAKTGSPQIPSLKS